jgi:hypothetical protein
MIFRRVLALAALALVGACNMVVTKEPVFSPADAAGAPALRPGVWGGDRKADCQVDESKPLADWPSCASGFVVMDDHRLGDFGDQGGKHLWSTTDYVLAAGNPRVMQVYLTTDPMLPAAYFYAAYQPLRFDDQGRIVAGRAWFVVCGPPPPQPAPGSREPAKQRMGTLHPFAGLTMDSDGDNCAPDSPGALLNAARSSRGLTAAKDLSGSHWVRDGEK